MAKIEDIDSWFNEFREEMLNLLNNFHKEASSRFDQIYKDIVKLSEKMDRTFDEINQSHKEIHEDILATIYSYVRANRKEDEFFRFG